MASQLFDPFEVVREEVQESVGRAEALAASFADPDDPWRQQGPSHGLPPTAGTEPRSKLDALLRSLDSDLDNLRDALSSIEARRDRYATTDDELAARHEYLRATRAAPGAPLILSAAAFIDDQRRRHAMASFPSAAAAHRAGWKHTERGATERGAGSAVRRPNPFGAAGSRAE